jgi:molybdenum ABC transporter ATP-binding protein
MLRVGIEKQLREFRLRVNLEVARGETLVLVGPSGGGKTTVLNCIAGLVAPDGGRIVLGERTLFDAERGTDLPAERRGLGYLFQDFALFPHLSVFENIAYPLRCRRRPEAELRDEVGRAGQLVGLDGLMEAKPGELSGGEQQRVALARAVVFQAELLLLDEPLASLDVQTRGRVRSELRRLLRRLGRAAVLVTHDYADALTFGDRIAVMDRGQLLQVGDREELLARPRSRFVAELTGVNFFEATITALRRGGLAQAVVGPGALHVASEEVGDVLLSFLASDVTLSLSPPEGSALNVFPARVKEIVHLGERARVATDSALPLVAEITAESLEKLRLKEGDAVYASVKATAIKTYR